jgi:putative ABC transport system substrate-binding protein
VRAQQPTKVAQIGFLDLGPASARSSRVEALWAGLREFGYVGGKNIVIEFRWAERVEQLPDLAAELVRMNVDVIFAPASTPRSRPHGRRPKRSRSCSATMPTPSAPGT